MPVDTIGHSTVPPDVSITDAIGNHHDLTTALADLVDNSIDAAASRVHIRFVTAGSRVTGLRVIDDGNGMGDRAIDDAMAFARRRDYGRSDLGHYGLGLKAASLSQADVLDVHSRAPGGMPVGRRIAKDDPTRVWRLDPVQVGRDLESPASRMPGAPAPHGTVVQWDGYRGALSSPDPAELERWLSDRIEAVRTHLGLVFHRILSRDDVAITIDQFDTERDEPGSSRKVQALDPLGTALPGPAPTVLTGRVRGVDFRLRAVVLTPRAMVNRGGAASARSGGNGGQGLYVYRRDRLLQAGGWNSVIGGGRDQEYLRIGLDIDDALLDAVRINPEKSGVVLDADMRAAIHEARTGDGRTFAQVLERARGAAEAARTRQKRPVTLVEPQRGLSREMYDAIAEAVDFADADPIGIRWKRLDSGDLMDVDVERRTLWINDDYRSRFSNSMRADDAPLLKTLLLLLLSRLFEGSYLGERERRELEAWNAIIAAALREESPGDGLREDRTHDRPAR